MIAPLSRRVFLLAAGASLLGAGPARAAASPMPIETWSAAPVGATGVPPGWQKYETPGGHPAYDFTVVEDAGRRALAMKSAGEHSTIAKEVQVDLAAPPAHPRALRRRRPHLRGLAALPRLRPLPAHRLRLGPGAADRHGDPEPE